MEFSDVDDISDNTSQKEEESENEGQEGRNIEQLPKNENFLYSPFKKVNTQISKGNNFTFQLKRNKEWFNRLRPEFHLYL